MSKGLPSSRTNLTVTKHAIINQEHNMKKKLPLKSNKQYNVNSKRHYSPQLYTKKTQILHTTLTNWTPRNYNRLLQEHTGILDHITQQNLPQQQVSAGVIFYASVVDKRYSIAILQHSIAVILPNIRIKFVSRHIITHAAVPINCRNYIECKDEFCIILQNIHL
ncbi:hypothetical protein JTB14_007391 [Gonioctena quinquepunctata]|nr:hypothetical protein JTB14_007391 [Gonioctena quinquepunctata]